MEITEIPTGFADEIRLYLKQTNTSPHVLSRMVSSSDGVISGIMFRGLQADDDLETTIRKVMLNNPDGCGRRRKIRNSLLSTRDETSFLGARTTCFKCGVRSDIGCRHHPITPAM